MKVTEGERQPGGSDVAGLVRSLLWLTLALAAAWPVFAYLGQQRSAAAGVAAATIAGLVCWVGAALALALVGLARGTAFAVQAMLLGIGARTGVPILAGVALHHQGGELAQAGLFGMILCYYFLSLAVETALSVRLISCSNRSVVKA